MTPIISLTHGVGITTRVEAILKITALGNQDFWKKNARKIMEENNGELVHCLARVLKESEEKLVLAVAAHDVGVLVKEVPEKRRVWDGVRVKARVMELMGDSDPEVRYESLKAVQEFLRYAFGG